MIPFEGVLIRPLMVEVVRGETVRLSPREFRIAACLLFMRGKACPTSDLVDLLYGDDPDGGPDWASTSTALAVRSASIKLQRIGLRLSGRRGGIGGYRAIDLLASPKSEIRKIA